MKILGNILWFLLGGAIVFVLYCLDGILLCLTIIGIPFGVQCFKLAKLALFPFGKTVRNVEKSTGILAIIMNVLWILVFGVEICAAHLFFAFILAITIVGIPFARQHIKLCAVALSPFGKEIIKG